MIDIDRQFGEDLLALLDRHPYIASFFGSVLGCALGATIIYVCSKVWP